ncbi:MAG TPA: nucleoside hydrolase [Bryobacteraceae bacterium]|nr:nucleoside hydrolase [Bryobacteraceae bacterium]
MRLLTWLTLVASLAAAQGPSGPDRVIFDTDCAFFNDDGAALAMLLEKPDKVNVLGLTVVPGNLWPLQGAEDMFRILDVMKRGAIPLYLGAATPLVHTRAMAEKENHDWGPIPYLGMFGQDPPEKKQKTARRASHRSAVDFLIDTIDREPGEVTLLAIGPMTNIAIALRMRPDLETKIKRIVFMGGAVHVPNYDQRAAEFNFWFDPEAASIVLRSAIKEKIMFGLDICNHARINKTHFDQIVAAKTPVTELYKEDLGKRFKEHPDLQTYIWDCLAAGYLLDPSFVTKHETAYLDVDTAFGKNYGAVKPLDRALAPDATPVEVMLDLDFAKFFALYKDLLTQPLE